MQIALDLFQLLVLFFPIFGVRIWFLRRLLVQINLLLFHNNMAGSHPRSEHIPSGKSAALLGLRRLLTTLLCLGRLFSGLLLLLEAVFGCPFLGVFLGSFKSFFFLLRELLLFLFCFGDIGAPRLPHALAAAEGVAEVGAVLLACARRRVDGVEADACQ